MYLIPYQKNFKYSNSIASLRKSSLCVMVFGETFVGIDIMSISFVTDLNTAVALLEWNHEVTIIAVLIFRSFIIGRLKEAFSYVLCANDSTVMALLGTPSASNRFLINTLSFLPVINIFGANPW